MATMDGGLFFLFFHFTTKLAVQLLKSLKWRQNIDMSFSKGKIALGAGGSGAGGEAFNF